MVVPGLDVVASGFKVHGFGLPLVGSVPALTIPAPASAALAVVDGDGATSGGTNGGTSRLVGGGFTARGSVAKGSFACGPDTDGIVAALTSPGLATMMGGATEIGAVGTMRGGA